MDERSDVRAPLSGGAAQFQLRRNKARTAALYMCCVVVRCYRLKLKVRLALTLLVIAQGTEAPDSKPRHDVITLAFRLWRTWRWARRDCELVMVSITLKCKPEHSNHTGHSNEYDHTIRVFHRLPPELHQNPKSCRQIPSMSVYGRYLRSWLHCRSRRIEAQLRATIERP